MLIYYTISAKNGKVAPCPADREGPSAAEMGPVLEEREVRPGARRVMPPGSAPIAAG